jgi:hypothetical protein
MTENKIDLASMALKLEGSSVTQGPDNVGMCRDEPPFEKSLENAMHMTNMSGDTGSDDTDQLLPPTGQELPPDVTFDLGLEGIQEVRALADAIAVNAGGVAEKDSKLVMSRAIFSGDPAPATGFSPLSLDRDGYFDGGVKQQISLLGDLPAKTIQEWKSVAPGALFTAENVGTSENRQSPIESQNSISLALLEKGKSEIHVKELLAAQPQMTGKSREAISSIEMATHLRVLKSSGGGEARLQLHPAELGRMTVSLTTEGSETRVTFMVDNAQAKQAVEASLPRLRVLMDEAGLNLTDADVSQRDSDKNEAQSDEKPSDDNAVNSLEGGNVFDQNTVAMGTQLIDAFV